MTIHNKKFNHVGCNLPKVNFRCVYESGKRFYVDAEGNKYPSVTSVLSILSKPHIDKWKIKVGVEAARRIMKVASDRGNKVHSIIEDYINNEDDYAFGYMPNIIGDFNTIKKTLDLRVGDIYSQESVLFSKTLGVAGRVDCVGEFDGKISIIDFKTSKKPKKHEWISNYFMQACAYSIAWEEMTGQSIEQLVIIIAADGLMEGQVFVEHRNNWVEKLVETIYQYHNPT